LSEARLEWSSPADLPELAMFAGPWRRRDAPPSFAAAAPVELFHARLPDASALADRRGDPLPALARAQDRVREALRRGPGRRLPPAESELLAGLRGAAKPDFPADAPADVQARLGELLRRATGPARVESSDADRLEAVTAIGWSGHLDTFVAADVRPDAAKLHRLALAAALRTRVALARGVMATLHLAGDLTLTLGARAAWQALPLAWRYVQRLLDPRP